MTNQHVEIAWPILPMDKVCYVDIEDETHEEEEGEYFDEAS